MWRIATVYDSSDSLKNLNQINKIQTEEQVRKHADLVIQYIKFDADLFINKYKFLPNVLAELDKIIIEYGYLNGLIYGASDSYFKVLVISKLCNDPLFGEKLNFCDEYFKDSFYKKWLPHYEKLKAMLPSIKPKYNI